ncbi:signal peptidase I [Candidatus Epulonipiscium viviparus]|uniref:signal peptidase I n=1 Tax=Candidatus Epulonipiscium viviparus TaxID=420336 RepID=UPI002738152C|nr:signal peptidase I [Candidatus Epulopiscium viviparus]
MNSEFMLLKIMLKSLLLLGLVTTGIQTYFLGLIIVQQNSMNPTLWDGDILLTNKLAYQISTPKVGDIIIFYKDTPEGIAKTRLGLTLTDLFNKATLNTERTRYVKRVVAISGDVVDIKNGTLYVNTLPVIENFTQGLTYSNNAEFPMTVNQNCVYVLGDNREISLDSRNFGQVPIKMIESRVESKLPWQLTGAAPVKEQ